MLRAARALCGSLLAVAACSISEHRSIEGAPTCVDIAREYQAAMPDALVCDPAAQPGQCAAGRPMIVSQMNEDGSLTLEGLCLCEGAVNPARTATLDAVLARFYAAGCTLEPCWCPPPDWLPPRCLDTGVCSGVWSFAP